MNYVGSCKGEAKTGKESWGQADRDHSYPSPTPASSIDVEVLLAKVPGCGFPNSERLANVKPSAVTPPFTPSPSSSVSSIRSSSGSSTHCEGLVIPIAARGKGSETLGCVSASAVKADIDNAAAEFEPTDALLELGFDDDPE